MYITTTAPTPLLYPIVLKRNSGYYDGTKFHRNIKGFMVQGGDPLGTGKGGESIWGGPFPDEFHQDNKHDRRGMVSAATGGSAVLRNSAVLSAAVPLGVCLETRGTDST